MTALESSIMKYVVVLISVLFFMSGLVIAGWIKQLPPTGSQKTDLTISVLELSPAPTARLFTGDKVTVRLGYAFSRPSSLRIWAKPAGVTAGVGYESSEAIRRGRGELTRDMILNRPGKFDFFEISARGPSGKTVYVKLFKATYSFVEDPKKAHLKADGIGSSVSNVSFSPPYPAILRVGTLVKVTMEYEVNTEHGVKLVLHPSTTCRRCVGFDPSDLITGSGSISRNFQVFSPAHANRVTIRMTNTVGEEIYRKVIQVDYTYK